MRFSKILIFFFVSVFLLSCNITKRRYLQGYYFQRKGGQAEVSKNKAEKVSPLNNNKVAFTKVETEVNTEVSLKELSAELEFPFSDAANEKNNFKKTSDKQIVLKTESVKNNLSNRILSAQKSDPDNSLVQKPLSLFWIVILIVLVLYLSVLIFGAGSLLPLGHVLGIAFAALLLLWLLRVV